MPKRYPSPPLRALARDLFRTLTSTQWERADTPTRVDLILRVVCTAFGFQSPGQTTIPWHLAEAYRLALRNKRLREQFNGENISQLADRHGLTPRQVRRIVRPRGTTT